MKKRTKKTTTTSLKPVQQTFNSPQIKRRTIRKVCESPKELIEGISDMFVNFDYDKDHRQDNFDFNESQKLQGWGLLSQTILNKFQP